MLNVSEDIKKIISHFKMDGSLIDFKNYGQGHINSTYLVNTNHNDETKKYILQKINTNIFKNPIGLMNNIYEVTNFLKNKIVENNGDPNRETLTLINTIDDKTYFVDDMGDYWRCYDFITNTVTYETIESNQVFTEIGISFGNFQNLLKDFPIYSLVETIPNFHNIGMRIVKLKEVIKENPFDRVKLVEDEIKFILDREHEADICLDLQIKGELPTKVTHNDTKINNILIDKSTKKGICIIDLDTIMPGLTPYDFGDSIRFGANTALEDEKDLSKVSLSLDLFEAYSKGFLEGSQGSLNKKEIEMLPMGGKLMTYVTGIRFLTDFIEGDVYYKTSHENHNLDRARNQLALVKDIENKFDEMKKIISTYS